MPARSEAQERHRAQIDTLKILTQEAADLLEEHGETVIASKPEINGKVVFYKKILEVTPTEGDYKGQTIRLEAPYPFTKRTYKGDWRTQAEKEAKQKPYRKTSVTAHPEIHSGDDHLKLDGPVRGDEFGQSSGAYISKLFHGWGGLIDREKPAAIKTAGDLISTVKTHCNSTAPTSK